MGVIRSAIGIRHYLTSCQAYEQENETLAFPATISTENDTGDTTSDHIPGLDLVREPTNHTGNQVPLLYDEDTVWMMSTQPTIRTHKNTCTGITS